MPTGDVRRVCLLTGAGGTLGARFCAAYADRYDIVAVCRTRTPPVPSQYESYVDPLSPDVPVPDNDAAVFVVQADLTAPGQIERVVDIALARFDRIDLVVNAAAHSRWHVQGLTDPDGALSDLDAHLTTNVQVPARLVGRVTTQFWAHRAAENRAANRNVVNVSSLAGSRVYPGGQAAYAASKAALNQLSRHQAADLAAVGVRVNAVAPNSFPAIVSTTEVADAIVALDTGSVSGRVLAIDAAPQPPGD